MTPAETGKLIAIIKSQYQHKFVIEAMTNVTWHELLNEPPVIPFEAARHAAMTWMKDNDWPPSVKDLRDLIASQVVGIPDADEAWRHLQDWLKAGYPSMTNDRRPPLPDLTGKAVKEIGGTSMIRNADKPEQVRERFRKAYDRLRREQVAVMDVPASLTAIDRGTRKALPEKGRVA